MKHERFVAGAVVRAEDGDVGVIVAAVAVHAGLERVVGAQSPIGIKSVLDAGGGVQRVRSVIVRIDKGRRAGAIGEIAGIDGGERFHPAVLREVCKVESRAAAQNGFSGVAQRVGHTKPWCKSLAVIVRYAGDDPVAGERGIDGLIVAGSNEESVSGVVTQAVIDGELFRGVPRVLRVESEPLYVLREAAVTRA